MIKIIAIKMAVPIGGAAFFIFLLCSTTIAMNDENNGKLTRAKFKRRSISSAESDIFDLNQTNSSKNSSSDFSSQSLLRTKSLSTISSFTTSFASSSSSIYTSSSSSSSHISNSSNYSLSPNKKISQAKMRSSSSSPRCSRRLSRSNSFNAENTGFVSHIYNQITKPLLRELETMNDPASAQIECLGPLRQQIYQVLIKKNINAFNTIKLDKPAIRKIKAESLLNRILNDLPEVDSLYSSSLIKNIDFDNLEIYGEILQILHDTNIIVYPSYLYYTAFFIYRELSERKSNYKNKNKNDYHYETAKYGTYSDNVMDAWQHYLICKIGPDKEDENNEDWKKEDWISDLSLKLINEIEKDEIMDPLVKANYYFEIAHSKENVFLLENNVFDNKIIELDSKIIYLYLRSAEFFYQCKSPWEKIKEWKPEILLAIAVAAGDRLKKTSNPTQLESIYYDCFKFFSQRGEIVIINEMINKSLEFTESIEPSDRRIKRGKHFIKMGKVASDIQENENAEKLYSRAVNIFYQEKCTPAFYKKLENFMITFVIDHALQRNEGIDEKDFIKDLSFYLVREKKYFLSNINYSIFKYFNDNKMYVACYNFMHLFPENSPFRENWKSSVEDENYKITQNKKKTIYKKIRAEIQEIISEKEKYERISEKMKEHLKKYNDNNSLTLEQNSVNSENFFKPEERNKLLNFPKSHLSSFDFFAGEKSILFLNEEEEDYINEIRDLLKLK